VPSWQSECSKSHRRGQMVMIEGALITGGKQQSPLTHQTNILTNC
jgi:hypothetical protein